MYTKKHSIGYLKMAGVTLCASILNLDITIVDVMGGMTFV